MNICYIADSQIPSRTANSIHVMKMCQAYASLVSHVTLIVPNWQTGVELNVSDIHEFYDVSHNFTICKVPYRQSSLNTLYQGLMLPLASLRSKPHIAHTRNLATAWGLTHLLQTPTIYEIHGIPNQKGWQNTLFNQVVASKNLRSLIVITQALAQRVTPLLPQSTRLVVAPDGVDDRWLENPISRSAARMELKLEHELRSIAVYTGHLYAGRGIELIVELAQSTPDYLFLIVGGTEADVLRCREQYKDVTNLQFLGFKPPAQMLLYLRSADVLLMPYAHRIATTGGSNTASIASPMKMFEYMAAGRPILASSLPVLQEVLQDGVNALLLPYDEPEQWHAALAHLRHSPQSAEDLGNRAYADVKQYTWTNRAKQILEQSK